jgi:hypothetical protein
MAKRTIPDGLVEAIRDFLSPRGERFFRELLREYGEINVVLDAGRPPSLKGGVVFGVPAIPHPVHLREGMQVRNAMRQTGLCDGWDDHDFDNNWIRVVCRAILPDDDLHTDQAP